MENLQKSDNLCPYVPTSINESNNSGINNSKQSFNQNMLILSC